MTPNISTDTECIKTREQTLQIKQQQQQCISSTNTNSAQLSQQRHYRFRDTWYNLLLLKVFRNVANTNATFNVLQH